MDSTNLPSKISRAVGHYLVGLGVVPVGRCFNSRSRRPRDLTAGPVVDVAVMPGNPDPVLTGSDRFEVRVFILGTATKHPDDTNDETEAVEFDAMVGAVRDALMQSTDDQTLKETRRLINVAAYTMPVAVNETPEAIRFAANNADLENFTLTHWSDGVYGQTQVEDAHWAIVLSFHAAACETQLTGYT